MAFFTDKQTLEDLNITGKYKPNSLFSIFNKVITTGAERLLEEYLLNPLTDEAAIVKRSKYFLFFSQHNFQFPISNVGFSTMENFLLSGGGRSLITSASNTLRRKVMFKLGIGEEEQTFRKNFAATIKELSAVFEFLQEIKLVSSDRTIDRDIAKALSVLNNPGLQQILSKPNSTPGFLQMIKYDHYLREVMREQLKDVMDLLYRIDVYISVAAVAKANKYVFANVLPRDKNEIEIKNCRHPAIPNAKGNTISLNDENNLLFLTGANMAGKSTLMKSFGIAVYLAHAGFPVAADAMNFSVKDGLFSSINVSDNIDMGYSHFYAEVLRVKQVAQEVSNGKSLVVIFDELFKGTNVKDAYDATLAVTEAFAGYSNCFYIISTHIIEVGDGLKGKINKVKYAYMPTVMHGNIPHYTYELTQGITSDRHGMRLIGNEKILELWE